MDGGRDERTSFFAKPFGNAYSYGRTYGSAGRNSCPSAAVRPKKHIVKHEVSRSDTIQGIALKYGVTIEEIKRANKLWTNDSIFLRTHLEIPVTSDNEAVALNGESEQNGNVLGFEDDFVEGAFANPGSSSMRDKTNCDTFPRSQSFDLSDTSPEQFLSRHDEYMEKAKADVDELTKKSEFASSLEATYPDGARGFGSGSSLSSYSTGRHGRKAVSRKFKLRKDDVSDQFFQL